MGFYQNEQYVEDLVISGNYLPGIIEKESIAIYNNESISLNLEDLYVLAAQEISNPDSVSIIKIVINWGDDKKDSLSPSTITRTSTIGSKPNNWKNISHEYHFNKEIENTEIKILIYNTLNELLTIKIPVEVQYKSMLEYNTFFELISGNITNDNKVSYVINDANTAQMIVLQTVSDNWAEDKKFQDNNISL